MLERKLQVSSSTFALKNPAGDQRAQQSHSAEDGGGHAGTTDAVHDPWDQHAACGEMPALIEAEFRSKWIFLFCCLQKLVQVLFNQKMCYCGRPDHSPYMCAYM